MIFVWRISISVLLEWHFVLRYFDSSMSSAIVRFKNATAQNPNVTVAIEEIIKNPWMQYVYEFDADINDRNGMTIETLQETYFWFQLVQGMICVIIYEILYDV